MTNPLVSLSCPLTASAFSLLHISRDKITHYTLAQTWLYRLNRLIAIHSTLYT